MTTKRTVFEPNLCGCCGQTTDYALPLDRGTSLIVLAVYNHVARTGKNRVHMVNEMLAKPGEFQSYKDMVAAGKLTLRMIGNTPRARYHGLLAFWDHGSGEYLLTRKGGMFLNGDPVQRVAIIDKKTHTKREYMPNDFTTFDELMKKEVRFWDIPPFEVDEHGTFISHASIQPQGALL